MRAVALVALCLAGCVTQPAVAPPTDVVRLQAVPGFDLTGRIGVTTADDGFNGTVNWRQHDDEVFLSVHGALGAGRVEIAGDADGVEVRASDGEIARYPDPTRALRQAYGWTLPVDALRYWVLGVPSPASRVLALEQAEALGEPRVSRLVQDGWQVAYTEYRLFDGEVLPRKLTLTGQDLRVKLVVRRWTLDRLAVLD